MADFDVIVVGAGVVGSATAYALIKRGLRVLLLEQFERVHSNGSSHGGSRITRRTYVQEHFTKMMVEAFDLWSSIEAEANKKVFLNTGGLNVGKKDTAGLQELIQHARDTGVRMEVIDNTEIEKRYGLTYSSDFIGVVDKDAGILEASKAVDAIQGLFEQRGGVFKDNTKVLDVVPGAVVKVVTAKQTFRAKKVVLTPGGWAVPLFTRLGVQAALKVEQISVCYWDTKNPRYTSANKFPVVLDYDFNPLIYVLPVHEYPGRIKICGHGGPECKSEQRTFVRSPAVVNFLAQYVRDHFPDVDGSAPSLVQSCVYTNTADENFLLDYHPVHKNIILASPCSGHGFKLAPVTGEILADLATDSAPKYDMSHFKLQNFMLPHAKL